MDGAECRYLGLATHYIPHGAIEEAKARIIEHSDRIEGALGQASVTAPEPRIADSMIHINKIFGSDRLEEIFAALQKGDSDWADAELAPLRPTRPPACKVALRPLADGQQMQDSPQRRRDESAANP